MWKSSPTIVVAGVLVAACSHEAMAPAAGAPISAHVTVSPLPAASGVPRSSTIQVTFDRAMDSASCAGRFVLHTGDSSGVMVPGRMTWDTTYHHMTFVPDSMMAPGTPYFVLVRDSMMTRDSTMGGGSMGTGGMGGGGMMGGTGSGKHLMPGSPMMFDQPPTGAIRTSDGMMWSFTTAS
jgi:hypothetical protein